MIHHLTNSLTKILVLFGILAVVLTVNYLEAAWSPPTSAPTGGNVDLPINTGGVLQEKNGSILVNGLGSTGNLNVYGVSTLQSGARSSSYCDASGNNCLNPGGTLNSTQVNSNQYCDANGANCTAVGDLGGTSVDTSGFLNTGNTAQTKTGGLTVGSMNVTGNSTVNGQTRSDTYCDRWGNNCSTASSIYNTVNNPVDTSSFLDTSNTGQTKAGSLVLGGLRVNTDPEVRNSNPSILFNDVDSGQRRWLQRVGDNNLSIRQDRNGNGDFGDDGRYAFLLDGGSDNANFDDDSATFANQVRATEYCDRSGGNCISPSAFAFECVSGVHREGGGTAIETSSLGNNYSFSSVFVASSRNSGTQPEIRCTGGWTMTGCSAGTNGGTADNDESMDGRNMCVGDQTGDNAIHARCCRIVIN